MQLQRALRLKRHLFVSWRCAAKHKNMLDLMTATGNLHAPAGSKPGQWRWYKQWQKSDFFAKTSKRGGSHKSEMVTLIVPEEKGDFINFPNVTTLRRFIDSQVWFIDHTRLLKGMCQR